MKVIFIGSYTLYDKDIPLYDPGTDAFFLFGMGQFIAEEFYNRNYPVTFENWRMDLRVDKVMEKELQGIKCKIFPSKRRRIIGECSKELENQIKLEAKKVDVVFHFMGTHKLYFGLLAHKIKQNTIICTHLGGANPFWKYKNENNIRSLFYYWLERYILLKPFDHFISICRPEVEYYEMLHKSVTHMPIFGISREHLFTIKDKTECRIKLGLPLDKKILIQVGRADKIRGFDWILDVIDSFKENDDIFLIFIGLHKEDEFYPEIVKRNVYFKSYLNHGELSDYYNASDLLFYLINSKLELNFAGTSYVPLEALACGIPVIATTFHHFPGEEINEVSRIPENKQQVIPLILELLSANVSRERCREIVLKQFSWDTVINKHWELYNRGLN